MATLASDRKLIISRDRVEFYSFTNFYTYGKSDISKTTKTEKKMTPAELYRTPAQDAEYAEFLKQQKERFRTLNRIRSHQNLQRLVNTNKIQDRGRHSFLTLTYKQDVKDINQAQRDFAKFIQRLDYLLTVKKSQPLKYIAVKEFQDKNRNGVIHFHVILFNVPYIHWPIITKCWSHGSVDIRARDKQGKAITVTRVALYMAKYMAKGFKDKRLDHKKKYFGSSNLDRPIILREPALVDMIKQTLPPSYCSYTKTYDSKYMGQSIYAVYEHLPIPLVELALSEPVPIPRHLQDW